MQVVRFFGVRERIKINPKVCGGKPVVRGTRIPVRVMLDELAAALVRPPFWRISRSSAKSIQAALEYASTVNRKD
ncbi:MAG TPA: DUF433 domain-containing protein [Verrucomicrobiae bacterium]|nr:DUF433 domain-containing protein [Verrucomicrobiae bacterium]